jgi:hypothetical protein
MDLLPDNKILLAFDGFKKMKPIGFYDEEFIVVTYSINLLSPMIK